MNGINRHVKVWSIYIAKTSSTETLKATTYFWTLVDTLRSVSTTFEIALF